MNFTQFNLDPRLQAGSTSWLSRTPRPSRKRPSQPLLTGQDLIGTAQTGTGKTAAFVLPILNHLMTVRATATRALIITPPANWPSRSTESIHDLAYSDQACEFRHRYGGVGPADRSRRCAKGVEIIVACPGRLLDLAEPGSCKFGSD